jgi:hypothetical protein
VVWVPKRSGKDADVADATRTVPDARAKHFWDEAGRLMAKTTRALGIPVDAWDIYLVYGPDARWDGALPPKPDFWMHQLNGLENTGAPFLDGKRFAAEVAARISPR